MPEIKRNDLYCTFNPARFLHLTSNLSYVQNPKVSKIYQYLNKFYTFKIPMFILERSWDR